MSTEHEQQDPKDGTNFETDMKRLETIVAAMESGELTLEQMITHFEEGSQRAAQCTKRLDEVERRIEKLVKKDGKIVSEPFDPEADDD